MEIRNTARRSPRSSCHLRIMEAQIKLGRIFGVQIGLHYSWLLIATLLTLSLGGHFQTTNPGWSRGVAWATALTTAALFFTAILLHELAHAVVAKSRGAPLGGGIPNAGSCRRWNLFHWPRVAD